MNCPRCQHENSASVKFCGECGAPLKGTSETGPPGASYVYLQRALTEALERETATSEILRVISSSPTDLQPVLNAVAESAARLCGAYDVAIFRREGDSLELVAHHGPLAAPPGLIVPLVRGTVAGRAVLERRTIHVRDLQAEAEEFPEGSVFAKELGHRTLLSVPLLREGVAIGTIQLRRAEANPFTDKQIELLKTFADQAVIAIENVRLFNETKEALEQQTATGEILRVISTSPTDLQPVLDAVVTSAARFCGARDVTLFQVDGDRLRFPAHFGPIPVPSEPSIPLVRGHVSGRTVLERQVVHLADAQSETEAFPDGAAYAKLTGHRTILSVPLLREGVAIGALLLRRTEVQPFTDKQIALLKTFAAQAVIAIENVRLFTELEGRNRDLTATSEILRTIAHAPTDTQPVFDTIVRSAARLCHAVMAAVMLTDGRMLYLPANYGSSPEALAAVRARYPRPVDVETSSGEAILTRSVVHVPDVEEASVPEFTRQNGRMMGFRSLVTVPMLREGEVVGAITVCRLEPGRFSDTEVALLKTFADQAVIAIENVRLFTELQEKNRALTRAHGQVSEALERQTGTSEILRAISSSPTNVQPVFDTIVESAARLCSAESAAVYRFEGEVAYFAAGFHFSSESVEAYRRQFPRPLRETDHLQRVVGGSVLNIADIENDPHSSSRVRDVYRSHGVRSTVLVPMLREGRAIGAIGVSHHDLAAFSDERVELLKTFADQAVIAIENVRLFKELQQRNSEVTEALEQKTATSEILRVISGSPTDTRPVFETIAQSAVRLCGSLFSAVFTFTDGLMWLVAHRNFSPDAVKAMEALYPARPGRETGAGRAILDRTIIEITDVLSDPEYGRDLQSRGGWRSTFAVPMLREGTPIGAIAVGWAEPGPASPGNIALLQTFADQAVIAIENVRLFKELEARNRDLTATSEILQVIARSPTDVQPVFNTIAERAMRLCDAAFGVVLMFDGALIHLSALANVSPEGVDALRQAFPVAPSRGTTSGRVILTGDVVQIPNALEDPEYKLTKFAHVENFRCTLGVPMLHQGRAIGVIVVTRPEPGTFSEEQVQLLKTFADQAVIAIENVRLFTELEARNRDLTEALEQQTRALS